VNSSSSPVFSPWSGGSHLYTGYISGSTYPIAAALADIRWSNYEFSSSFIYNIWNNSVAYSSNSYYLMPLQSSLVETISGNSGTATDSSPQFQTTGTRGTAWTSTNGNAILTPSLIPFLTGTHSQAFWVYLQSLHLPFPTVLVSSQHISGLNTDFILQVSTSYVLTFSYGLAPSPVTSVQFQHLLYYPHGLIFQLLQIQYI